MTTPTRMRTEAGPARRGLGVSLIVLGLAANAARADTVASLLGNFTINQYCGMNLSPGTLQVHYAVVFGQLPALRELHLADTDGDGVTSQAERDAYVGRLAPELAGGLTLKLDGEPLPLRATRWSSSLPAEQGGFSLRVDVDFSAPLPDSGGARTLTLVNQNYADRLGWHEIVVQAAPALGIYDTNAHSSSLTGGLTEALSELPAAGPLDERQVRLHFIRGAIPAGAAPLTDRAPAPLPVNGSPALPVKGTPSGEFIVKATRRLVAAMSAPQVGPGVALAALFGALLLGSVHALSPGHGKSIVGAYLIGSRGTARHAAFLGLTVTLTHTIGVFVLGFSTLYASRFIVPERLFPVLSALSAALVFGMGVLLLLQRTRALAPRARLLPSLALAPRFAGHHVGLHSHGGRLHSHLPPGAGGEQITWRSLLTLGVSGGLVPCPSAMVLLLAAVALGKTAYGMLLVLAFSTGLALTLTAVGLLFLQARNRLPRASTASWQRLLPLASAAAITLIGLLLCLAAYRSFSPATG